MGFIVGQAAEEAAEEGQPSTTQPRKDAAAAAASYALIAPKLPAALEHCQQRASLPWYVLRAAAADSRPVSRHRDSEVAALPARRTAGSAFSPIALEDSGDESPDSFDSDNNSGSDCDAGAASDDDGEDDRGSH